MYCKEGCPRNIRHMDHIRDVSDSLNAEVVDQINESQELVMLSNFSQESNEFRFKKILEDRISEVSSWRWVLEDLAKRLDEAIESLKYEQNALHVVVDRIRDELENHSKEASKPGALCPIFDSVEEAIMQEYNFLREQKKKFENLVLELNKQVASIGKTRKRITDDLLNKEKAITIDKTCAIKDYGDMAVENWKKKRKKGCPLNRWVRRSEFLKRVGLKALFNAVIMRNQVRGARVQLSIAAQAHASRVDAILKRRLHSNQIKLEDLVWQRNEAVNDYKNLEEESLSTEKSIVETLDKLRIVEARIAARTQRPGRELTKDDVNRKLKDEVVQLKKVIKELRNNLDRIKHGIGEDRILNFDAMSNDPAPRINPSLQYKINKAIAYMDSNGEDIGQIIHLDNDRIQARLGIGTSQPAASFTATQPTTFDHNRPNSQLTVIIEETEDGDDDDYPFDD